MSWKAKTSLCWQVPYSQAMFSPSSHACIWELNHKEGWAPKNWCFWTVMLEKTRENPLDCKEIQPVNPKGNQPWTFTGRTDAKVEAPILWPPDAKTWLIGKDPDAGKDRRQEDRGTTEGDSCVASLTRQTWVFWASSGGWWWAGKPWLQSMGSQRGRRDGATELNIMVSALEMGKLRLRKICRLVQGLSFGSREAIIWNSKAWFLTTMPSCLLTE